MNILLTSVGRRPYLVRWFQEALADHGIAGQVIAADVDALSPARAFADEFVRAPRVDDPGYRSWLKDLLTDHEIALAVSINDFELSAWAHLPPEPEWAPLIRLEASVQELVEDKFTSGQLLTARGVTTPATWLGSEAGRLADRPAQQYVTKGRFGSASRGLRFTTGVELVEAVTQATEEVTTRSGRPATSQMGERPADFVVIQEQIIGTEYGLDIVCDLSGRFAGVLARRKIAMRAGETDRAESVDSETFEQLGRGIADAIPHPGTIDIDVIVDEAGTAHVIDINPRFGGGYPFSHLAGGRVPHAYVAWAAGRPVNVAWLRSDAGVTGGKYVEAVALS